MILCIIQARMSSTRLPGKVLMPLLGRPMLARQVERVRRAKTLDRVVLATSTHASDEPLVAFGREQDMRIHRGSLDDVLDRYYDAATSCAPDHVVRITGDCPLIDPEVIDLVVQTHIDHENDYTSNTLVPTYPDGLDTEAFRFRLLERAHAEAKVPSEREHVTAWMKKVHGIRRENVVGPRNLSAMRWTVDEIEDYEVVRSIYESLYPNNPAFDMNAIVDFIAQHPKLTALNAAHERDAGYRKSLEKDKQS